MSYLTSNAILSTGIETLTVPAAGALTSVNVTVAGIDKTTDSIIITLNLNAEMTVNAEVQPFVLTATTGTGFTVAMNLANGGGADATCFLSWAVFR